MVVRLPITYRNPFDVLRASAAVPHPAIVRPKLSAGITRIGPRMREFSENPG